MIETAQLVADKDVARVVFCTGKVYYELLEEREKRGIKDIALVRIEQLYPFPFDLVVETIKKYSRAQVIWCQVIFLRLFSLFCVGRTKEYGILEFR